MKKDSPLYLALFLAIVSALAGGALAFANNLTAPVIAANAEKAEKASLLEMYPDTDLSAFETIGAEAITADHPEIESVYKYGSDVVIFKCSVSGFEGGTVFLVAINANDGTIDNFKAISNGDTKGIGSKITDSSYAESLIGKDANGELDTISGATLTSTPVVDAIRVCAQAAAQID